MALAAAPAGIGTQHLVSRACPAQWRPRQEDRDRGNGTKAAHCFVEVRGPWRIDRGCSCKYRFRERLNDNPILRGLINPGRSRRDEPKSDMALIADEKKGLVLLSLCPTKSGFWCSRCRTRRPYVSWNWLGNHQVENKAQTWMPI